jgi:hypothetical protein
MKYDTVYHDKKRPDLLISSKLNDNIVMVEVDENQHFSIKHLKEDDARFKNFYVKASEQGKSLSVVRVVPGENSKTSMFKTEKVKGQTKLKRTNGYIEKNSENYNKYIKESVNKIVRIIGDKQSYLYKDQQVSIGPTVDKNSTSPIFSDTSSPDVSPTLPRARAIITKKTSVEKDSRTPYVPPSTSSVRPIITNISPISDKSPKKTTPPRKKSLSPPPLPKKASPPRKKSLSPPPLPKKASPPRKKSLSPPPLPKKNSLPSKYTEQTVKVFSKNQKRQIVDMIQKHKDISSYVSSITGRKYKSSNIKLTDKDPIEVHLHVIQGASLGYKDSDILKGAEKLKKESESRKKSFFQYQK